jgi:putative membrane protein
MPPGLKSFLQRWLITTVAVLVAANVVSGIHYDNFTGLLVATLVLGFLNAFLKPIMMLLSLPLLIFSLGLFTLVINAGLLLLVGKIVKSFHVNGFWSAFWGALVTSIVSVVLNVLTGTGNVKAQVNINRGQPPPPKRDDSGGPMIDV